MAASAYTLDRTPPGCPPQPGAIGQFKEVVVDIVFVSAVANSTADASITPAQVGLNAILGAVYLGDVGEVQGATPDAVGQANIKLESDGTLTVNGLASVGTALDLDEADTAAIRLAIRGY